MMTCAIGMMAPQKLLADVTITSSTGTVTINSGNAGDLAAYLETASSDEIEALKASTIVFVGKFNSSDLEALDSKGCCVATTVDMSGAKFIKAPSNSNTLLYHDNYPETASEGTMCIVGSVKKKSAAERAWSYIETDQVPQDQINNAVIVDELPSEVPQTHDVYYRIPKTFNYYKVVEENYNRTYQVVNEEDISGEATIHPTATPSQMITEDNKNNFLHGYQDVNNNRIEVRVGDYVKVAATFDYYTNPATLKWVNADSDYNDGDPLGEYPWYASESTAEAPTDNNQTQTAYIGGTQYIRYQDDWTTDLSSVGEQYDYSQMKFTYWKNTITNAITSNYVPDDYLVGKTNDTFKDCSKLESVTFNSGTVDGVANNSSDVPNFTTVVIGANVPKIGDKAFQNISSITTLDASAAENLTEIGEYAFSGCTSFSGDGTGKFHVPNSVQTIKKGAFESCYGIVNLYFDADSQINSIAERAFFMADEGSSGLKNVYVNVNPAREVPCAKGAFNKTDCCNQTAVGTARARLHYPPQYYDFYVGEYKSQYNSGGITQAFLDQAYANASNGWQEFMSSGILMADGVNWRTFSDELPYYVPESPASDGTVREIYLVHGYDVNKGAAILVRMKVGDIIPKNTGVIVHYTFNTAGGAALYLPPVLTDQRDDEGHVIGRIVDPVADALTEYDEELYPSDAKRYKPEGGTTYFKNYLKKLNKVTTYIDNVEIKNGKKTYRNFFFCNNDDLKNAAAEWKGNEWSEDCLNGWGFLRAVHGEYTISNKAYLHFPVGEGFPGSESVGIGEDHTTDTNPNPSQQAKQFGFITIDENGEEFDCTPTVYGIATNVQSVLESSVNNDCYYNMQGMKVENPSKGIYIKNGKKYVIK